MTEPPRNPTEFATLTDDDLVTGEAVALDLPAAGLGIRMASGLIDFTATYLLAIMLLLAGLTASLPLGNALLWATYVLLTALAFVGFPATLETLTRGRSLGKLACGLRTVREDGGPISAQHALVRALVGYVEIYALGGAPAFLAAMLSMRGKRLGDYAAGTFVIRERVALALMRPVPMPPPLAGWAASADVAQLPSGLNLAVRGYLGRLHQVTPESRARLGVQLANRVAEHVSPGPPPNTPPEAFLAAVIATRRDRDRDRLFREHELRRSLISREI